MSESYDKGILGVRKTLATAISALIEYPARGVLGGFSKEPIHHSPQYHLDSAEDVQLAWKNSVQDMVYGDLIDKLFVKTAETADLTQHDSLVQGMHEFILVK